MIVKHKWRGEEAIVGEDTRRPNCGREGDKKKERGANEDETRTKQRKKKNNTYDERIVDQPTKRTKTTKTTKVEKKKENEKTSRSASSRSAFFRFVESLRLFAKY